MGKSSIRPISGPFSMAMLNNKRVIIPLFPKKVDTTNNKRVFIQLPSGHEIWRAGTPHLQMVFPLTHPHL